MNVSDMERHAVRVARLLRAMGNANRLLILCRLAAKERSVGELAGQLGLSQSAVSQHLARLREDGLVRTRRRAQSVLYSLAGKEVRELIATLAALACTPPDSGSAAAPLADRGRQAH